tara:strand:- start:158 stop:289 length:132 start_codon:yes stop_codon:yes gene_type:complete
MKNYYWLISLLLIFQIVLSETIQAKQIRIVSTANVHGETDPCG